MSTIVLFPLHRRHSLVVKSVDDLLCVGGDDANALWRARMVELGSQLRAGGLSAEKTREQLYAFHDAVQQELTRRGLRVHGRKVSG